jgi:hypothetical protein
MWAQSRLGMHLVDSSLSLALLLHLLLDLLLFCKHPFLIIGAGVFYLLSTILLAY